LSHSSLIKAQKKILLESAIVRPFHYNKWSFEQTNIQKIYKLMNPTELVEFGTENRCLELFHVNNSRGLRKFVFKQSDEGIEGARFRMKM
jgi:hypothetical protein